MEKVLLQDIRAGIEFEAKRIKDIEAAAKKAAPKQAPKTAAAPKSNAKKKAA